MPPIDVQVAFQGGGAKLVNLLAVAEVLEKAHNDGVLRINRVAGTSAGSIVACLLASGIGIPAARLSLDTDEMRETAKRLSSKTSWYGVAKAVTFGSPLKSLEPLTKWLGKLLSSNQAYANNKRIAEVCAMRSKNPMKLLIVSSDLTNRGSHVAADSEFALNAIEDSCGIPIAFRTWKGAGYQRVDGGLCANLPVDFLKDKEQDYGEVLAISFQKPTSRKHDSLGRYLLALIDTAISAGEDRAVESLPKPNVFSISTDLTTFDFRQALEQGLSGQYGLIRNEAEDWLRKFVESKEQARLALKLDPWSDQSPSSKYFLQQMGAHFSALETDREINYQEAELTVWAPSLNDPANTVTAPTDKLRLRLTFSAGEHPIHMMSLSVTDVDEQTTFDASTLRCKVQDPSKNLIDATLIPMSLPGAPKDRNVAVCFSKPLPPRSGPYTLSYWLRGSKLLRTLQVTGKDCVCYFPTRAAGAVGEVKLILMVPENANIRWDHSGRGDNPRTLDVSELQDEELHRLKAIGVAASNVTKESDDALWSLDLEMDVDTRT